MIRQELNITVKGKKWHVTAFYPVTRYHVNEIMRTLKSLGCDSYILLPGVRGRVRHVNEPGTIF